jgi:glycosyltransferase involved in cell wall biosynthesis
MRILHLGKFFPPYPGGIERFVAELAAAQVAQGLDVRVLAHAEPGSWRSRKYRDGHLDVALAACPGQWLYAPFSPAFPLLLARVLREFRPDLLHLHVPNTSAFWPLLSPAARRLSWIVHWHADIPLDTRHGLLRTAYRIYRPWEQALLRRARAIIATSPPYLDSSAALQAWRDKSRVIALAIAPSPPMPSAETMAVSAMRVDATPSPPAHTAIARDVREAVAPWPAAGLRILAVGRLSYFKGFDILLRALAQVPEASLVLAGDGECRRSLHDLARVLGVDARVNFVGRIDMDAAGQRRLAALHAQSEVFCLPSTERAESFGLVLLEAMRAGKPVIASAIPGSGVGFVVRDGETGLLVPPGDAAALAIALRALAHDAPRRTRMGAQGAQRYAENFTLDEVTSRVTALYREVLRDTTAPARSPSPAPDAGSGD